jgi:hypothetical protein
LIGLGLAIRNLKALPTAAEACIVAARSLKENDGEFSLNNKNKQARLRAIAFKRKKCDGSFM